MIEKALEIPGWMSETELQWLAEQAKTHYRIVEIGSHLGRSTRALADNTPGTVYAVDTWYGPPEVSIPSWEREKIYDQFLANMNGLLGVGKVVPLRVNHRDIVLNIIPDMIFIDGSHQYEDVKRDLEKWRGYPALLCGHDATFTEVCKALEEIPDTIELVPETDIWVRVKHGA